MLLCYSCWSWLTKVTLLVKLIKLIKQPEGEAGIPLRCSAMLVFSPEMKKKLNLLQVNSNKWLNEYMDPGLFLL